MVYCDTHAHLADGRFGEEACAVAERAAAGGVGLIIDTATRPAEWDTLAGRAGQAPHVRVAIGVHPRFAAEWSPEAEARLLRLAAATPSVVAIGEAGLDFWHGRQDQAVQERVFARQLTIARDLGLPLVCHNRKSWDEFLRLVKSAGLPACGAVCHAFGGGRELARQLLDLGFYLSFCGGITYPRNRRMREAAIYTPDDRLLTETDAPDMPPVSRRGGLCRPEDVAEVVRELAALRGSCEVRIAETVAANVRRLFGVAVA